MQVKSLIWGLAFLTVACSSGSSGDKAGEGTGPGSNAKGGTNPGGFNLADAQNVVDVDAARLQSGLDISTTSLSGNKLYRFSLPRAGSLGTTGRSSLKSDCNGDPDAHWSLRRVTSSNTLEAESIAKFTSGVFLAPVNLQAGTYVLVFESAPSVTCSTYSLALTVRAQLAAEPGSEGSAAGSSNRGTGSSGSTPNNPPQSNPKDPEQRRIWNRELKDTAGVTFYAYASPSEGCVPVWTRTVADLRRSRNLTGSVRLNTSTDGFKDTIFELSGWMSGFNLELLSFKDSLVGDSVIKSVERTLINDSTILNVSLDDYCASKLSLVQAGDINSFGELPLWATDSNVSLKRVGNFPDARFTYRTIKGNEYIDMQFGIDVQKTLEALNSIGTKTSDVTNVEWMLGHADSYEGYPLSDWQPVSVSDFLAGRISIRGNALAARGIQHFASAAVALRITLKSSAVKESVVIPVAKLCQAAYTRTDGAAFHKALFNDLTHPEWNDKPSISEKTGCAFIGGVR